MVAAIADCLRRGGRARVQELQAAKKDLEERKKKPCISPADSAESQISRLSRIAMPSSGQRPSR